MKRNLTLLAAFAVLAFVAIAAINARSRRPAPRTNSVEITADGKLTAPPPDNKASIVFTMTPTNSTSWKATAPTNK